ncbi:MAG TPA: potassium transporter Kup [Gemmatimonadaceae bacterium]|nr:potassium transporter Kup [Gemmatimonadaceae bacterium]
MDPAPPGAPDLRARDHVEPYPAGRRLAVLTLGALGVVYGDIGTSPLYALRECFSELYGLTPTRANVYGVLSLIVWSILLVVAVKYLAFILRADNKGEGGILALMALLLQTGRGERRRRVIVVSLGLFGAALLYGDGIITPPVSVFGAMEGLAVAAPGFERLIVPVTFGILFTLFLVQKRGTGRLGAVFGPVVLVWFATIAVLGAREIIRSPGILLAVSPWYAVEFFATHNARAFFILGSVVLAITGAEALYADIGHFGKRPIRLAFFAVVLPALLLNYFGQGALVLRVPEAAENPFYMLAPRWFLYPLLGIANAAAIVASQALISGAFSLTRQAVQLGYIPRVTIIHTSKQEPGQIYIPEINAALMVGCLALVVGFRSAGALAAAYGIAVTGTMVITSVLFAFVARGRWGWPMRNVVLLTVAFLVVDVAFFAANAGKIAAGGWVPLVLAVVFFTLMTTWKRGRELLAGILRQGTLPMELLLEDVQRRRVARVPGTAVFMTSGTEGAPVVLLHHLKHNRVLHEEVILLSVQSADVPEIDDAERVQVASLGQGFFRVVATFGFMETPNVPAVLEAARAWGIRATLAETSYVLGRERLLPYGTSPMARWRKKLFVFMSRNARSATEFFGLPPNRVVELGTQLEF